ncbi:MAG: transcription antitermination factor NusB [Myxococcales bacterium]|nr:transcription antitermination factor NusB [Myxococcales bacterium]
MGARRTARERALQALYQLDMSGAVSPSEALESAWSASAEEGPRDEAAHAFALELVIGVREHLEEIDRLIEQHSHNWRLDRMSRVDRNVLRLGVFELLHRPDIPRKVTLNEAVELGKTFGSEESSAFINGLLDKIAAAAEKP